ncbi:MAG TPA: carbohydrate kinase family protein [Gaiellaceae bacterium]|nr:carbohydrate kinase family protein [Gaiellaceae bacterium]
MTDVVCLGILVADVIARPVDRLPERGTLELVDEIRVHGGGCALNTASALARLGLRAAAAGKLGVDPLADVLLGLLEERGVDGRAVVRDPVIPTSATVALVGADGERTFLHLPGANASLSAGDLDPELIFSGRALHLGGTFLLEALDGEPTATVLAEARRRGLFTSLDTAYDASGRWNRVLPSLEQLDLFTPSIAEARGITGEREPDRAARNLRELGVREVAVTLGPEGCYVVGETFEGHIPAPVVEVVDGTGSGDAFVAGFLHAKLAELPLEDAARFANATGALAATASGAFDGLRGLEETSVLAGLG